MPPRDYLEAKVAAVVGIEIEITGLVGKFKLSQNKEAADRQEAAHALYARGQVEVASDMENPPSPPS